MFLSDISPKKAVKGTSFTVARDIKFQLVIRALPLEHWNEVKVFVKISSFLLARNTSSIVLGG